jgi:multicomponent Na+:H+ antiporter subunit D
MLLAMGLAATLCVFIGSQPQYLYALLPWKVDYWPYDTTHVLAQLQLLFFSALAFVWLNKQGIYPPELRAVNLDAEWLYRKLVPAGGRLVYKTLQRSARLQAVVRRFYRRHVLSAYCRTSLADFHLADFWPTGSMVLWIAVVLGSYLLLDTVF